MPGAAFGVRRDKQALREVAAMKTEPTMTRHYPHSVALDHRPNPEREEVFFTLRSEWRGTPAQVEMTANRYRYADGELSGWRILATDARQYDENANGGRGPTLTETARRRLSEACAPLVQAWLDSDEYQASRRAAFCRAVERKFSPLGTWNDATSAVRRLLDRFGDQMDRADVDRLERAADAYDAFLAILNGTGGHGDTQ